MVWFDLDRTSVGSGDWRIASSPESAAAFAALAADPCFSRTNPLQGRRTMPHPTAISITPTPVALVAPTWDDPLHTWGDPGAMWNGWVPTGGIAAAVDD